MNRVLLTVLGLFFCFIASSQKIEINPKGLFINRYKVTKQTTARVVDSLLGKPDRVSTLANTIWTYDKLGLFVYFAPQDSFLRQVNFELVKRDLKFSPAVPFSGSLVIHNNRITQTWSLNRLKRIKALHFENAVVHLHPAYTSYLKIFFEFDEGKTVLRSAGVALNFKGGDTATN